LSGDKFIFRAEGIYRYLDFSILIEAVGRIFTARTSSPNARTRWLAIRIGGNALNRGVSPKIVFFILRSRMKSGWRLPALETVYRSKSGYRIGELALDGI
jgi:hypothetical protein